MTIEFKHEDKNSKMLKMWDTARYREEFLILTLLGNELFLTVLPV